MITNRLFETAKILLPIFIQNHKKQLGKITGVYMATCKVNLTRKKIVKKITTELLGDIPKDKEQETEVLAKEKIIRLHCNNYGKYPDLHSDFQLSSFESEDLKNKKYGGGIRANDYYVSIHGFPHKLNQKFALLVCLTTEQISFGIAHNIVMRSQN